MNRIEQWGIAENLYWAKAYLCMEERDYKGMRMWAGKAKRAKYRSSQEEIDLPPAEDVKAGIGITRQVARAAKEAVLAEMR